MQVIFSYPATVAIIVAFFLDCTLSYGQSSVGRDSDRHWWGKFRNFIQILGVKSSIPCLAILTGSSLHSKLQVFSSMDQELKIIDNSDHRR
ncbi:hypothetical protein CRYUN_Cryun04dG0065700 [Craigia yunnanensis]